jgi:serine protease Do
MFLPLALALAAQAAAAPSPAARGDERLFARVKDSVYTIEVHSGNQQARNALGSGYLVSASGLVVTNYHVVGSYVEEPQRYFIRVRNPAGERAARLLRFDLVNDLAVLQVDGAPGTPLKLAGEALSPGAPVVAFGNPEGLGLSLIEGIFNGVAAKGVVDRMLLSMPLNSGMSGGPILNGSLEVVGTNVSVMWGSNSLSFGVPVAKVAPLLALPPIEASKQAYLQETQRQLAAVEELTVARLAGAGGEEIRVGRARSPAPAEAFECWNDVEELKEQGITKTRYQCNLQFSPQAESIGPVGSVELLVEHFAVRGGPYGFYGGLVDHAASHHEVSARDPENGVFSAPECVGDRVRAGSLVWKVETCVTAYVKHPGFLNLDLVATSLTRTREAVYVALHAQGFHLEPVMEMARRLLRETRLEGGP